MIGGGFGVCAGIFIAQYAGARKHHTIHVIIAQPYYCHAGHGFL